MMNFLLFLLTQVRIVLLLVFVQISFSIWHSDDAHFIDLYAFAQNADPGLQRGSPVDSQVQIENAVGIVSGLIGRAFVVRNGRRYQLVNGTGLFRNDRLMVEKQSFLKILLVGGESVLLTSGSTLDLEKQEVKANMLDSVKSLMRGTMHFFVNPNNGIRKNVKFKAGQALLGVRGTSGIIKIDLNGRVTVAVLEGELEAKNISDEEASVLLKEGQLTLIEKNKPPFPPRDFTRAESDALTSDFGSGVDQFDSKSGAEKYEDVEPNPEELQEEMGKEEPKGDEKKNQKASPGQSGSRSIKKIEKPLDDSAVRPVEARENLSNPFNEQDTAASKKTQKTMEETNQSGREDEKTLNRTNEALNNLSESAKEKATDLGQKERPQIEIKIPEKPAN